MAHALSLTDGTTTISLSSSGCILTHYVPAGPDTDALGQYKPVTETIEFVIGDTTTAAIQTKLQAIERLLVVSNQRVLAGTGPRLFLNYQVHNEAAAVRSEIFAYRLQLDDDAPVAFVQLLLGVRLVITRAPFWEGPRTAIPISNGNGSNNTSGLAVRNHDDAGVGDDNWCNIAGAAIVGSLPAPLELKLVNASGATRAYADWYVANNIYGQALAHIIEGETAITGYGTVGSDAACSNGQYATRTGTGWTAFRWNIPAATLNLLGGRYMRLLTRFRTLSTSDREVKATLYDYSGLAVLARSANTVAKYGEAYIQDCGALPFPAGPSGGAWGDHVLEIAVKTPSSEVMAIDFVQLTPTEPLLYRKLIQRGFQMAVGDAVVDDGIENNVYFLDGVSSLRYLAYVARSEPVHVWPGIDQRLLLLHDGAGQAISWQITAQAWYRPRRTLL